MTHILGTLTDQWLKAGQYEITIAVTDNVGGSGVDASYGPVTIRSRGPDDEFDAPDDPDPDDKVYSIDWIGDNKFQVWVGPDDDPSHPFNNALNDCVNQREQRCRIDIIARDMAGNPVTRLIFLNIDYTSPTAQ